MKESIRVKVIQRLANKAYPPNLQSLGGKVLSAPL
jgi:hypothetical protein